MIVTGPVAVTTGPGAPRTVRTGSATTGPAGPSTIDTSRGPLHRRGNRLRVEGLPDGRHRAHVRHRRSRARRPTAELLPPAAGRRLPDARTWCRAGRLLPAVPAPPSPDLAQQGAHRQHRSRDPVAVGLELAAQRRSGAAVSEVQRGVPAGRRRPGELSRRVPTGPPAPGPLWHHRGADQPRRRRVRRPHRPRGRAGAQPDRGDRLGPAVRAGDQGHRARHRLRGDGRRPGQVRGQAGPDHR